MAYCEVIPFKVFMASPSTKILSMVDGGLTFFVGTGVLIGGLIIAEKLGVTINDTFLRWVTYTILGVSFLWFLLKNPLFRHLLMGA